MKQSEYVKTVIYNNRMINIGLDDYGQTHFIEYAEDGELKEECVGSYIEDYEDYIEHRFGEPEINCPIYNDVTTSATRCCGVRDKAFCHDCRKFYNDVDWVAMQKRREDFEKWIKENRNETM